MLKNCVKCHQKCPQEKGFDIKLSKMTTFSQSKFTSVQHHTMGLEYCCVINCSNNRAKKKSLFSFPKPETADGAER